MSEVKILRRLRRQSVTIGTSSSASTTLRFDDMAGGILHLGSPSSSVTSIAVYGSHDDSTDYREVHDASGSPATITIARQHGTAVETVGTTTSVINVFTALSNSYAMPDAAYGLPLVRLVADAEIGEAASTVMSFKS